MNRRIAAGITLVLGVMATGCSGGVSGNPTPGPLRYSTPSSVAWTDCGGGFQCGAVAVPLNYANPSQGSIRIALVRKPATDPSRRIGSLLLNPGGPGGSGIAYARSVARLMAGLNARFDLVGFDPRGVGQSSPVQCLSGPQTDSRVAIDPVLDDAQERKTYVDSVKATGLACEQKSGGLLPFVDTASAARDMDVIRTALGDSRLTYFGLSYGTYLGQVYAHLFPAHVRALALDAVVDPSLSFTDREIQRAVALEANLQAFLAYCREFTSCMLGSSGDPGDALTALMNRLDRAPLQVGKRKLTRSLAMDAVLISLYSPRFWDVLQTALFNVANQGEGLALLDIADSINGRHADGTYSNFLAAGTAISCRDFAVPSAIATYDQIGAGVAKASALFGPWLQYSGLTCSYWPVKPGATMAPLTADGAPPILLIGGTADPATPYASAEAVNKALAGSVLLTRRGYGHGSYDKSECVRQAVDAYLIDLELPSAGTVCQSDP